MNARMGSQPICTAVEAYLGDCDSGLLWRHFETACNALADRASIQASPRLKRAWTELRRYFTTPLDDQIISHLKTARPNATPHASFARVWANIIRHSTGTTDENRLVLAESSLLYAIATATYSFELEAAASIVGVRQPTVQRRTLEAELMAAEALSVLQSLKLNTETLMGILERRSVTETEMPLAVLIQLSHGRTKNILTFIKPRAA